MEEGSIEGSFNDLERGLRFNRFIDWIHPTAELIAVFQNVFRDSKFIAFIASSPDSSSESPSEPSEPSWEPSEPSEPSGSSQNPSNRTAWASSSATSTLCLKSVCSMRTYSIENTPSFTKSKHRLCPNATFSNTTSFVTSNSLHSTVSPFPRFPPSTVIQCGYVPT